MSKTCAGHRRLRMEIPGGALARGEVGFTMVEVLASLALLAITVTPLMGLFTMAPMLHAYREQQLRAAFLAQLRLEQVKNKATHNFGADYNQSVDTFYTTTEDDEDYGLFDDSDAEYRYTVTDDNYIMESTDVVMRDITITVWYDKNGNSAYDSDEQGVTLVTKVARRRM